MWEDLPKKEKEAALEWWKLKQIIAWDYECWRDDPEWFNKVHNQQITIKEQGDFQPTPETQKNTEQLYRKKGAVIPDNQLSADIHSPKGQERLGFEDKNDKTK